MLVLIIEAQRKRTWWWSLYNCANKSILSRLHGSFSVHEIVWNPQSYKTHIKLSSWPRLDGWCGSTGSASGLVSIAIPILRNMPQAMLMQIHIPVGHGWTQYQKKRFEIVHKALYVLGVRRLTGLPIPMYKGYTSLILGCGSQAK